MKKYEYKDLTKEAKEKAVDTYRKYEYDNGDYPDIEREYSNLIKDVEFEARYIGYFISDFSVRIAGRGNEPTFNHISEYNSDDYLEFNRGFTDFKANPVKKAILLKKLDEFNEMFVDGVEKLLNEDAIKSLTCVDEFVFDVDGCNIEYLED